jgi:hypothetical protein
MFQKCLGIFGKSIREHLAIGPGTFGKSAREYLAIEASAPPPIAEEGSDCIEREGISLFTGMHTPQCRSCLNRVAELENAFRFRLEKVKVCAKHPGRPAVARCTGCHLPHCEKCLYFTTTGWLRKKIGMGPLCLVCFRRNTLSGGRENWISLPQAQASGLLRGMDPAALL